MQLLGFRLVLAAPESSPGLGGIQLREEGRHKTPHGPSASSSQLQGLVLLCLSFPPCPHLPKVRMESWGRDFSA